MSRAENGQKPQNKKRSGKKKLPVAAVPYQFKPGQSGNPGGKVAKGITYWFNQFGTMAPSEVAEHCEIFAKKFREYKTPISVFGVIGARALLTLMNDADARLLAEVLNRVDGKVMQPVSFEWREEARQAGYDPDSLIGEFVRHALANADVPDPD